MITLHDNRFHKTNGNFMPNNGKVTRNHVEPEPAAQTTQRRDWSWLGEFLPDVINRFFPQPDNSTGLPYSNPPSYTPPPSTGGSVERLNGKVAGIDAKLFYGGIAVLLLAAMFVMYSKFKK